MDPTSNAAIENLDFLVEGDQPEISPVHTGDVQEDTAARENDHIDAGRKPIREPIVQITDWDLQTLLSPDEEPLKRSRYRIGGSADNILSLTSYQSLLPLEWKVLRSSQSQGTLANLSGDIQESTDGGHKPTSRNKQDVVDDIIGDEVAFKVCTNVLNCNPGTACTIDSKTAFPIVTAGSPRPRDANYPKQSSNGLVPGTEMLPGVEIQFNQVHSSAIDQQDPGLIDQLWTAAASPNSLYNTSASAGWESNSNNHESRKTGESPVVSKLLLNSPTENKQEFNQSRKKMQPEGQLFLQGQSLNLADVGKLYRKVKKLHF
ncbi:uncharacterized protein LOC123029112 [Varanus komodoensis]|uniref:uncharacterized protein LOC123029112 n=1 Tax=Varanus komodoensis TaxID=61221 RepID=UPI001CF7698B|nr:uncharacterized protein LOC123029112 [Varanus komodoensis]